MKTTMAVKYALLLALSAGLSTGAKADAVSVSIGNYGGLTIVVDGFDFGLGLARAEDYQNVFSSVDDILVTPIPNGFTLTGRMGVQDGQTRFSGHAWQWVRFFLVPSGRPPGRPEAYPASTGITTGPETIVDPKGFDHLSITTTVSYFPSSSTLAIDYRADAFPVAFQKGVPDLRSINISSVTYTFSAATLVGTPEPETFQLFALGMLGVLLRFARRRRR